MRVLDLDGREVHSKIKGDTQSQRPVSALRLATAPSARAGEPQASKSTIAPIVAFMMRPMMPEPK
jgi:hypothetical protein